MLTSQSFMSNWFQRDNKIVYIYTHMTRKSERVRRYMTHTPSPPPYVYLIKDLANMYYIIITAMTCACGLRFNFSILLFTLPVVPIRLTVHSARIFKNPQGPLIETHRRCKFSLNIVCKILGTKNFDHC